MIAPKGEEHSIVSAHKGAEHSLLTTRDLSYNCEYGMDLCL